MLSLYVCMAHTHRCLTISLIKTDTFGLAEERKVFAMQHRQTILKQNAVRNGGTFFSAEAYCLRERPIVVCIEYIE